MPNDFEQLRAILDDFSKKDYSRSLLRSALSPNDSIPAIDKEEADRIWGEIDRAILLYERCCVQCPRSRDLIRANNDIPRVAFNLGIERQGRNLNEELRKARTRAIEEIGKQDKAEGLNPLYPKSDAYLRGYNT